MSASTHKSSTGVSNYAYENFEQVLSFNLWDAYPRLRPPKPSPCKLIESLEKRVKCKETSLSSLLTDRIMKRTAELKMIDDTKVKRLLLKKLVDLYHAVAQLPYEFASQKERKECETRLTRIFTLFEDKMLHLIDIIKPPRPTIKVPCPIFRNGLDINKILREQVAPPLKSLKLVSDSNEKIQFIIDTPRDDVSLLWRKAKSLKEIIGKALAAAKSADIPRRYFEIIQESLGLIEFCICEEASVPSNYRKDISYLIELLEKDHPFDLELILHIKARIKPRMKSHYRGHKMAVWLNLIPQLHQPGDQDVSMRHHHFHERANHFYSGAIRPESFTRIPPTVGGSTTHPDIVECPPNVTGSSDEPLGLSELGGGSGGGGVVGNDVNGPMVGGGGRSKEDDEADLLERHYYSASTALGVTVGVGCLLLILNALIFSAIYYQRRRQASRRQRQSSSDEVEQIEIKTLSEASTASSTVTIKHPPPMPPARTSSVPPGGGVKKRVQIQEISV